MDATYDHPSQEVLVNPVVTPLHPLFVAKIAEADLGRPIDAWHSTAKRGGYMPTEEERRSYPPVQHKLVRRHPGSGRNALYIGSHASHIVGMQSRRGRRSSPN